MKEYSCQGMDRIRKSLLAKRCEPSYGRAMRGLRFVPYHRLGELPNVIVDGSPTSSTVLTLSHWPGSPTPTDLRQTSTLTRYRAGDALLLDSGDAATALYRTTSGWTLMDLGY